VRVLSLPVDVTVTRYAALKTATPATTFAPLRVSAPAVPLVWSRHTALFTAALNWRLSII